jgi:hypothetical protein
VIGAAALMAVQGCSLLVGTDGLTCAGDAACGALADAALLDREAAAPSGDGATGGATEGGDAGDATAPPVDLVAFWKLDDGTGSTAADSSRNGNAGVLKNAPTWTAGRLGGALRLTGSQYVEIPSSPPLDQSTKAVTVTAWVYRLGNQSLYRAVVHRQRGGAGSDGFYLGFNADRYYASVRTTTSSILLEGAIAPNDVWVHLAFTYDGAAARLFVNGTQQDTGAGSGDVPGDSTPVTIGAAFNGNVTDDPVNAIVDDVRIYARALPEAEISALAAAP